MTFRRQGETYQTVIVRFFNDPAGRLRGRVIDPRADRAWLVEDAAALYSLVFCTDAEPRGDASSDAGRESRNID